MSEQVGTVSREVRAAHLKERIYVTFTALAVVLAMRGHHVGSAWEALVTLAVTVAGTLLAIFVADVVSHIVVHERVMTRAEIGHAFAVSTGSFGVLVIPAIMLGLAGLDLWPVERALRVTSIVLIATLVVIGWIAVRRVWLRWWQRLLVLGAEGALGVAVVALELLAHG